MAVQLWFEHIHRKEGQWGREETLADLPDTVIILSTKQYIDCTYLKEMPLACCSSLYLVPILTMIDYSLLQTISTQPLLQRICFWCTYLGFSDHFSQLLPSKELFRRTQYTNIQTAFPILHFLNWELDTQVDISSLVFSLLHCFCNSPRMPFSLLRVTIRYLPWACGFSPHHYYFIPVWKLSNLLSANNITYSPSLVMENGIALPSTSYSFILNQMFLMIRTVWLQYSHVTDNRGFCLSQLTWPQCFVKQNILNPWDEAFL